MGGLRKAWLSLSALALMTGTSAAWAAPAATGYYPGSGGELTTSGGVTGNTVITFSGITLPANRSYLHRVVPDRSGFNVQFQVIYPGLNHKVNRFGPGRTETYTVNALSRVKGKVKVSGVKGSFGCFTLTITP